MPMPKMQIREKTAFRSAGLHQMEKFQRISPAILQGEMWSVAVGDRQQMSRITNSNINFSYLDFYPS
jgi:hypothetical protein